MLVSTSLLPSLFLLLSFTSASRTPDSLDLPDALPEIEARGSDLFQPDEADEPYLEARQHIAPPEKCAKGVHVIAAGGDGAANVGHYGSIYTTVLNVTALIPGSDSVSLPYPKASSRGRWKTTVGVSINPEVSFRPGH